MPVIQIIADALKASGAQSEDEDEDEVVEEEEDEESDGEVDVDGFPEDSEASSEASEDEEGGAEAQPAGAQQAKRQKLGARQAPGLGSVGWEASDDEEEQQLAVAADAGGKLSTCMPLSNRIVLHVIQGHWTLLRSKFSRSLWHLCKSDIATNVK